MYLTPRTSRRAQIAHKRRVYPVQPVQEQAVAVEQNIKQAPDRGRYKRSIQIVKHHVPVEPHPIADVYENLPVPQAQEEPDKQPIVKVATVPIPVKRSDTHTAVFKKQLADEPTQRRSRMKIKTNHVLVSMACLVFLVGMGVAFIGLKTNKEVGAQVQGASTDGSSGPEENVPALGDYVVAPHLPRYISINKLGVKGRVMKVGVDAKGQLAAPANVNDAGWYENSALPGDAGGAMLVDGHAYGPTKPGIFDNLERLMPGDQIQIERGDGQIFNFSVVKTQSFENGQVDMASALVSADTSKLGLNLITCSGEYNAATGDYAQRHLVYAVAM